MMSSRRRLGVVAGAAGLSAVTAAAALAAASSGPSSSQSPYIVRSKPGVVTKSILTVGDSVAGYRMAGIPDGLGAYDNGDGTLTVLMNHELGATVGAQHDHGARGSFVSRWVVDKESLTVTEGDDVIKQVATWNKDTGAHNVPALGVAIGRLCSGDLPELEGYDGRIFLSGEEVGAEGRAFAHVATGPEAGTSYELPHLGKFSFENALARDAGSKTFVIGTDDATPGEVYLYTGNKSGSGNAVQRTGLVGGTLAGIKVDGVSTESVADGIPSGSEFTLAGLGDVSSKMGAQLQTASNDAGVTKFQRPEDGHWDPLDPSKFYFVTTASFTGRSRLWRLNFDDPADPSKGGTIDMLLDGTEGQKMMDNITVDRRGNVLIQEDPGGQDYLAKIRRYDIASDRLETLAVHDPARFDPAEADPLLTRDEESSGIIDVSHILGSGWYLGDVQAHTPHPDPDLVEHGQLLAIHIPPGRRAR